MRTPAVTIRKASKKDFSAAVKLSLKLRDYHRKLDKTYKTGRQFAGRTRAYLRKDFTSRNSLVLVAETPAGKIVGFCLGRVHAAGAVFDLKKTGFIFDVYLEPAFRRNGIAGEFLRWQFMWMKKKGTGHVELFVDARNPLGRSAWKKHGFSELLIKMRRSF